jgi:hypothetical protein
VSTKHVSRVSLALAVLSIALTAATVAGVSSGRAGTSATACGVERWSIKTLTDPVGKTLRFIPRLTTITHLRRLRAPVNLPSTRIRPVEVTTYRVRARLVAAKVEDDSDIHLVIADPASGATMIAELPAFPCTIGATAADRKLIQRARASFVRACGLPEDFYTDLNGTATVTGVGFFDFLHGQRGVAPNGIELHPVIGFSGRCS